MPWGDIGGASITHTSAVTTQNQIIRSRRDEDDGYAYAYDYGGGDHAPDGFSESGSGPGCLINKDAYVGNGCCAGACGDTYTNCFDCPTTQEQDPVNYGGSSCFQAGSCIAGEPSRSCAAPSEKQPRGTGTEYAGWCVCPEGSFCSGGGCNATTPRQLWNPDEVRVRCVLDG